MQTISQSVTAGVPYRKTGPGKYFRLISALLDVDVSLLRQGAVVYKATAVQSGFWAIPDGGFDALLFESATTQTIKFATSDGGGGYDPTTVQTRILNASTISAPASVSVGVTATALLAADLTRRIALFRNAGTVAVYLGGADVSTDSAPVISPGETWVEDVAPGAAWYGISGSAAQAVKVTTYA